ncbi:MAG TPA: murein biosynthesis integral membrane protein MurJ [Ktedonobacteraceae bacterium]|nr:murein biosynthesis integral membrane protein MurJ [Ktedonobacteraceae bacterium]
MDNEARQPSSPQQEGTKQQKYYGWQYDQDDATEVVKPPSAVVPPRLRVPPQQFPAWPSSQQPPSQWIGRGEMPDAQNEQDVQNVQSVQKAAPPSYQEPADPLEPLQDMGTTLSYTQGMEFQYFDAPQPSQSFEQLRQERFQQLREERLRRQQRRMPPAPGLANSAVRELNAPLLPARKATITTQAVSPPPRRERASIIPAQLYAQVASLLSISSRLIPRLPAREVEPPIEVVPAAEAAQNTGMIQRSQIRRATMILTIAFVASRVLGLLRTSMFAYVFGTGITSDAYVQAFLIPDLIFNIVAGGALSSAFIPVFTRHMVADKDENTAWHIASAALNLAMAIMTVLALVAILFAPEVVPLYNAGDSPQELALIVNLTRIMLLQAIALGVGVIMTSVLNARQNFRLPAIGTVLYNLGLILGLMPGIALAFVGKRNDTLAVYAATWGVVLGAVFQVAVQVPGLFKVGMKYKPTFDWRHPSVIQIGRQMVPRVINAAMLYVSTFVDRGLIQLLVVVVGVAGTGGLITQYSQALQLMLLPLGVFGMSVSTAAFPTLAENVAKGRMDRVRATIVETLRSILFMAIPSSIALIVLSLPIIQVVLQHGRYTLADAQSTAVPLGCFAVGLAGLSAVEILTRSFYAMRDSRTPVIISIAQFVLKIALSLLLINLAVLGMQWGMGALALSTSIAGLLEALVLFWILHQRIGGLQIHELGAFVGRVAVASVVMAIGLGIARTILDLVLSTTRTPTLGIVGTSIAMLKLLIEVFVGLFIYIRCARWLGIEELGPIKRVLDRLKLSWI